MLGRATVSPESPPLRSFFILGAMKCGTTSLQRHLDEHPDVCFSEPKEPVFFESQYERGLDFYRRTYFAHCPGRGAVGEARTHNLGLPFVPERIHALLPEARLIAILRDPVDRAFSEWWHRHSRGEEPLSFEAALAENRARLARGERFEGEAGARAWRASLPGDGSPASRYGLYLDLGQYAEQIERYRALFPPEQLRVLLLEDLERDPQAACRELWAFLGVSPDHELADRSARNVAYDRVRSPLAFRAYQWLRRLPGRERMRHWIPGPLREPWRDFMYGRPAERPPMSAAVERELLDWFEPHNRALERLLARELPSWFEPQPRRTRPAGGPGAQ